MTTQAYKLGYSFDDNSHKKFEDVAKFLEKNDKRIMEEDIETKA